MSIKLVYQSIFKNPGNKGQYHKKLLKALYWQLNKRTFKKNWHLTLKSGAIFKTYPDCVVSSSLIYSDFPEYYEIVFLRNFLSNNDCVLDIGANVGHISLLLADVVSPENIYLFEPTPVSYERLKENWKLNGFDTNNIFQIAIGSVDTSVFINNSQNPVTTNSVTTGKANENYIAVEQKTLDSLIDIWSNKDIGLIKIDVEGYENEVFRGARNLIKTKRPKIIMFESLDGQNDPFIKSVLADLNYKVFQLDRNGNPDFNNSYAQNLFALPEEKTN